MTLNTDIQALLDRENIGKVIGIRFARNRIRYARNPT